jgi:hypothetical protein
MNLSSSLETIREIRRWKTCFHEKLHPECANEAGALTLEFQLNDREMAMQNALNRRLKRKIPFSE